MPHGLALCEAPLRSGITSAVIQPLSIDPRTAPIERVDHDLPAVPWAHMQPDALRARFAQAPVWTPEVVREPQFSSRAPAKAAVLVPIVMRGPAASEPTILLTQRTAHLSTHSGQIAFPGGKVDPTDADAVAAALRHPERTVVALAGDGDFLMNGQELATAVQYGCDLLVVLVDNGAYGTIRMHQEREYPEHVAGTALANPDFSALARAYGYAGVTIRKSADFEAELLAALARPQGTVIEVVLEPELISTRGTLQSLTQNALKR